MRAAPLGPLNSARGSGHGAGSSSHTQAAPRDGRALKSYKLYAMPGGTVARRHGWGRSGTACSADEDHARCGAPSAAA
eukprot:7210463-Prymnesium_polylepis.1